MGTAHQENESRGARSPVTRDRDSCINPRARFALAAAALWLNWAGGCESSPDPGPICPVPEYCQVSPDFIDFGHLAIGGCSEPQILEVTNQTRSALTIELPRLACGVFRVVPTVLTVQPGSTGSLSVAFCPNSILPRRCELPTQLECGPTILLLGNWRPAECVLSTQNLTFGDVSILGPCATREFAVANHGGGTLRFNVSESCGEFEVISGAGSYALESTDPPHVVKVRFCPTAIGPSLCSMDLESSCSTIQLEGNGVEQGESPICDLSVDALTFGEVTVGACSAVTGFTISNVGGGTLVGAVPAFCGAFEVISGSGSFALDPTDPPLAVQLQFCPDEPGTSTCSLNLGTACSAVGLEGTALPDQEEPVCAVSVGSLTFADVVVGECSTDAGFTISNVGGGELSVTVPASCGPFQVNAGSGSFTLLPTDPPRRVELAFCPTTPGPSICSLDLGSACLQFQLEGSGLANDPPVCALDVESIAFGESIVGECSQEASFTISNVGGGELAVTVPTSCGAFDVTSGSGTHSLNSTDPPSVVSVKFCPAAEGAVSCELSLGASCSQLLLEGQGVPPGQALCSITPEVIDFETLAPGEVSLRQFEITNHSDDLMSGSLADDGVCFPDSETTVFISIGAKDQTSFELPPHSSMYGQVLVMSLTPGPRTCVVPVTNTDCTIRVELQVRDCSNCPAPKSAETRGLRAAGYIEAPARQAPTTHPEGLHEP